VASVSTEQWQPDLSCPAGMTLREIDDTAQGQQNIQGGIYTTSTVGYKHSAQTTTTLSIPATLDTGWAPTTSPASVTSDSFAVSAGTITITVNGVFLCAYSAGAQAGCSSNSLPAGTDHVQASYSGSTDAQYDPSSATATVTVLKARAPGKTTTPNWAGYVATNDTYTSVSGSWTVPKANCGNFPTGDALSSSSTWVGIDGWGNGNVEQIGTDSNCASFTEEYHAWWEMAQPDLVKGAPHSIGVPGVSYQVSPGDAMTGTVTLTGTPGTYTLTLTNNTRGWTYTTTQTNTAASGVSAECIEEQPGGLFGVPPAPLTNFGSVTFTGCKATGSNGLSAPIWDNPVLAVDLTNGSTTKAATSPLSNDGKDFTVTWLPG
jgi:hypothetical protein